MKRQAEREDGQLLILPSESEEAGALSSPTNDLSSADKVTNTSDKNQEQFQKVSEESTQNQTNDSEAPTATEMDTTPNKGEEVSPTDDTSTTDITTEERSEDLKDLVEALQSPVSVFAYGNKDNWLHLSNSCEHDCVRFAQ